MFIKDICSQSCCDSLLLSCNIWAPVTALTELQNGPPPPPPSLVSLVLLYHEDKAQCTKVSLPGFWDEMPSWGFWWHKSADPWLWVEGGGWTCLVSTVAGATEWMKECKKRQEVPTQLEILRKSKQILRSTLAAGNQRIWDVIKDNNNYCCNYPKCQQKTVKICRMKISRAKTIQPIMQSIDWQLKITD